MVDDGLLVGGIALLGLVIALVRWLTRADPAARRTKRGGPRGRTWGDGPLPGEVWFAQVPFADGTGSKDRPVLVLSRMGPTCTVARFTSQDRTDRADHRRLPVIVAGLDRSSWVDLRRRSLAVSAFRRRVAPANPTLLGWVLRQSSDAA